MNRTETAALLAKHGVENEALLTDLAGPPDVDWEPYREALGAFYNDLSICSTPLDKADIGNAEALQRAHPHMPETRAMQARIAALEAEQAKIIAKWSERETVLLAEIYRLVGALQDIELQATNHGGWFEQDPFGEYAKLGQIAAAARE